MTMTRRTARYGKLSWLLLGLMVLTAALTVLVTPRQVAPVQRSDINLKQMVPEQIGQWRIDPDVIPLQLSPELQKSLNGLYSQTLDRTYVNPQGDRVMLSVAYGGDQGGSLALHKPEACYGAQGFEISQLEHDDFQIPDGVIPVTRLVAVRGQRSEPITYWATVGDKAIRDGLEQKLQKLRYAMTGKIPDGILLRVSTIDTDPERAYQIQSSFIQSMLASMTPRDRARTIGAVNL